MGATVTEKHFTYHVDIPGDDHEGAWTAATLIETVRWIDRIEKMLGSDKKAPVEGELDDRQQLRSLIGGEQPPLHGTKDGLDRRRR